MKKPDPCSQDAAKRVAPHVEPIKVQVLKYVKEHPGCTCEDATHALKLKHQTASARFHDLVEENAIEYDVLKGADGRLMRRYRVCADPRQVRMF